MFKTFSIGLVMVLLGSVMAAAQEPNWYRDMLPQGYRNRPAGFGAIVDGNKPAEPAKYWLGLWCSPMPPALQAQLNLPEKQGLLVLGIAPDSPAAKAGIAQHDVLVRAGDKLLTNPHELVQAVEASKEGKLKLELIHGGKPKTIEVAPAKRPQDARGAEDETPAPADWDTLQKWLNKRWAEDNAAGGGARPPMRFGFVRPGAIVPRDVLVPSPLPPNMSIVVSKEGDQPAKIVVKRGDEKWELTEKELDKLPADVRPHVERMLGHNLLGIVGKFPSVDFDLAIPTPAGRVQPPEPEAKSPRGNLLERMEKRFEEMNRRMDKLFKQMEQLNDGHDHHNAPEKPAEK